MKSIFDVVLPTLPTFDELAVDFESIDYPKISRTFEWPDFDELDTRLIEIPQGTSVDEDPEILDGTEEGDDAIAGGVRDYGVDIMAFYKSYRFVDKKPFQGKWGIFFVNKAVRYLTHLLKSEFPSLPHPRTRAIEFLWEHEIYHAKFDVGVLAIEAITKQHLYLPQKVVFRGYENQQPEEALANERAWSHVKQYDPRTSRATKAYSQGIEGFSQFFFDFMKLQPGAYSRFDEDVYDLKSEAAAGVFENQRYRNAQANHLAQLIGSTPRNTCTKMDVPRHLIWGVRYSALIKPARFIPTVKEIRESEKFKSTLQGDHKKLWENTKAKLIAASSLPGLDFKFWNTPDVWSARANDNFRAHLSAVSKSNGIWEALAFGNHKEMGHG
jgi:hypothetical protein